MSANSDKNQNVTFLFPNQNREKSRSEKIESPISGKPFAYSHVIKSEDLNDASFDSENSGLHGLRIQAYQPSEIINKRVDRPSSLPPVAHSAENVKQAAPVNAIEGLKEQLKTLNELQSKLRFMLKELEELVQD